MISYGEWRALLAKGNALQKLGYARYVRASALYGGGGNGIAELPAPVPVATTFDPAGGNTLTNGNLTTANVTGSNSNVFNRSVKTVSTGKWCAEFTTVNVVNDTQIGLVDTTLNTSQGDGTGLANRANAIGIFRDGNVYAGESFATVGHLGSAMTSGSKVMICYDADAHRMWIRKDGTGNWNTSGTANPATGVGGIVVPSAITVAHLAALVRTAGSSTTLDPNPANKPAGFSGWVDAPTLDVLVVLGQSNAVGYQSDQSIDYTVDPNVLTWHASSIKTYQPGVATGIDFGANDAHWAAELQYARLYRAANPTKRLAIFKWPADGAQLYASGSSAVYDWNVTSTGELFDQGGTAMTNYVSALRALGHNPVVRVLYWNQGETDASNSTMAAAYQTNLAALVAGFRNGSGKWKVPASAPIAITRVPATYSQAATVRAAQAAVAAADVGGQQWLINQDDLTTDDGSHFNKAGQLLLGERLWAVDQGSYLEP